jgi:hypothetical protein
MEDLHAEIHSLKTELVLLHLTLVMPLTNFRVDGIRGLDGNVTSGLRFGT